MHIGSTTAMISGNSGYEARVKSISPNVNYVHCFMHKFTLCESAEFFILLAPRYREFRQHIVSEYSAVQTALKRFRPRSHRSLLPQRCSLAYSGWCDEASLLTQGWISRGRNMIFKKMWNARNLSQDWPKYYISLELSTISACSIKGPTALSRGLSQS